MFLVAEYCRGPFYMGWHLYLRENRAFKRNSNGGWGWIRQVCEDSAVMALLSSIGIIISGDGTCDYDGIAELARQYPIRGRRCGGKLRGCIEIKVDKSGYKISKGASIECHKPLMILKKKSFQN